MRRERQAIVGLVGQQGLARQATPATPVQVSQAIADSRVSRDSAGPVAETRGLVASLASVAIADLRARRVRQERVALAAFRGQQAAQERLDSPASAVLVQADSQALVASQDTVDFQVRLAIPVSAAKAATQGLAGTRVSVASAAIVGTADSQARVGIPGLVGHRDTVVSVAQAGIVDSRE